MSTRLAPDEHSGSVARSVVGGIAALTLILMLVAGWQWVRPPETLHVTLTGDSSTLEQRTASTHTDDPRGERSSRPITVATSVSAALTDQGRWLDGERIDDFRSLAAKVADSGEAVPLDQRWRIYFEPGLSEGSYARQLDAVGIELGVIVGDGTIQYASKLAEARPTKRLGQVDDETRVYLTWDRGDLVAADRVLLSNAGVSASGKIILHFCLPASLDTLGKLETDYQNRSVDQIRETRFGVKRTFRGYEIVVIDQVPR